MSADLVTRLKEAASERHGQGSGTSRWDPNSDEEKLLDEAAAALEAALSERDAAKDQLRYFGELHEKEFRASEARVTVLEKVLEPFAHIAKYFDNWGDDSKDAQTSWDLSIGDFRRARAALSPKLGEEKR
jgi:hypothetical protein